MTEFQGLVVLQQIVLLYFSRNGVALENSVSILVFFFISEPVLRSLR